MKLRSPLAYILLVIAFFLVMFLLHSVFGLHYEPMEHDELVELTSGHSAENNVENETEVHQEKPADSLNAEPVRFEEEGVTADENPEPTERDESADPTQYFEALQQNYREKIVKNPEIKKPRTDVIIRYYHHAPDGNSAYALQKLGYYIHEREVAPEYADYQSNAIFYGDSVKTEDIQIVTYTLIKEGLPIKLIKPSKFANSWKARSIEIGTDTTAFSRSNLTLEELRRLSR